MTNKTHVEKNAPQNFMQKVAKGRKQGKGKKIADDSNKVCVVGIYTIHLLLKEEHGADALSLYIFYQYHARRQKTDKVKATVSFCCKGLSWSRERVRRARLVLIQLGLITDIKRRNKEGNIKGHYVKINYLLRKDMRIDLMKTLMASTHTVDYPEGGKQAINALSINNRNSLNKNKKNASKTGILTSQKAEFERFWKIYPLKKNKERAWRKWQELDPSPELVERIIESVDEHTESDEWTEDNGKYIPHAATFLRDRRWEDELTESYDTDVSGRRLEELG